MGERITVVFDAGDFPCLAGVIELRLQETERHKRIAGGNYSPDDAKNIDRFIAQLTGCLRTVNEARERYISSGA